MACCCFLVVFSQCLFFIVCLLAPGHVLENSLDVRFSLFLRVAFWNPFSGANFCFSCLVVACCFLVVFCLCFCFIVCQFCSRKCCAFFCRRCVSGTPPNCFGVFIQFYSTSIYLYIYISLVQRMYSKNGMSNSKICSENVPELSLSLSLHVGCGGNAVRFFEKCVSVIPSVCFAFFQVIIVLISF